MKNRILLVVLLLSGVFVRAEVSLPAVISDSMVLQQKSEVALWGWAKKGASVKVVTSWNNRLYTVVAGLDGG